MGLSDELEEETQWMEQNLMYVLLEQYAHVEVVVPEEQEQGVVEVPEIEGHVAPVQVQAVVSELIHVLPR